MDREADKMELKGYKKIEGIIEVITGLHIGGSTTIIEIGGKDNPVIKHPITKEPYIPGSSIKGKMRSLLEWKLGKINTDINSNDFGDIHKCNKKGCEICTIFGSSAEDFKVGPTRLIVRDAVLSKDYKEKAKKKDANWTPIDITEDKYENSINRITARANPRNFERVISGVEFSFVMTYRVFSNGDQGKGDEDLFKYVLEGLKLIEMDALGGAGSRGCGQVRFQIRRNGTLKPLDEISVEDFKTEFETEK
jgi:CRISPR-associated protein Csm3